MLAAQAVPKPGELERTPSIGLSLSPGWDSGRAGRVVLAPCGAGRLDRPRASLTRVGPLQEAGGSSLAGRLPHGAWGCGSGTVSVQEELREGRADAAVSRGSAWRGARHHSGCLQQAGPAGGGPSLQGTVSSRPSLGRWWDSSDHGRPRPNSASLRPVPRSQDTHPTPPKSLWCPRLPAALPPHAVKGPDYLKPQEVS